MSPAQGGSSACLWHCKITKKGAREGFSCSQFSSLLLPPYFCSVGQYKTFSKKHLSVPHSRTYEFFTKMMHVVLETCSASVILRPWHMFIPFLLKGKQVNNHINMRTVMLRNHLMAHEDKWTRDIVPRVIIIKAIYKKSVTSEASKLFSFVGMAWWAFRK